LFDVNTSDDTQLPTYFRKLSQTNAALRYDILLCDWTYTAVLRAVIRIDLTDYVYVSISDIYGTGSAYIGN